VSENSRPSFSGSKPNNIDVLVKDRVSFLYSLVERVRLSFFLALSNKANEEDISDEDNERVELYAVSEELNSINLRDGVIANNHIPKVYCVKYKEYPVYQINL
jgi:hypothetical protein